MNTVKPAPNQLFCKPDDAITKTSSGFLLDTKAAEKPRTAVVINVGTDVKNYKRDDRIIYKSYTINEIKVNNEEYFLVADDDVLGTMLEVE